jgi:hypothetical protein
MHDRIGWRWCWKSHFSTTKYSPSFPWEIFPLSWNQIWRTVESVPRFSFSFKTKKCLRKKKTRGQKKFLSDNWTMILYLLRKSWKMVFAIFFAQISFILSDNLLLFYIFCFNVQCIHFSLFAKTISSILH